LDGINFKHYFLLINHQGAICDANISNLLKTACNNIWIADNGMSCHDNKTDNIQNIYPAPTAVYKFIMPSVPLKKKVYCVEGGFANGKDIHSFERKRRKLSPRSFWW